MSETVESRLQDLLRIERERVRQMERQINEPVLYIGLVDRQRHGETYKHVTFTLEGDSEPFHEIPYFIFKHYDADFVQAVRAGLNAASRQSPKASEATEAEAEDTSDFYLDSFHRTWNREF